MKSLLWLNFSNQPYLANPKPYKPFNCSYLWALKINMCWIISPHTPQNVFTQRFCLSHRWLLWFKGCSSRRDIKGNSVYSAESLISSEVRRQPSRIPSFLTPPPTYADRTARLSTPRHDQSVDLHVMENVFYQSTLLFREDWWALC